MFEIGSKFIKLNLPSFAKQCSEANNVHLLYILSLLYQGQDVWYLDWKADKIVKNLSCLTYDSHCFSIDQTTIKNDTESEYFDTKNPCIFPFKYFDTTYNSCTRNGGSGFWCATSVDANLNWKTYGYCNDLCPLEGIYLY